MATNEIRNSCRSSIVAVSCRQIRKEDAHIVLLGFLAPRLLDSSLHARPDRRASEERNSNKSAHIHFVRAIYLHDTGVGGASFRVVDSAVFPTRIALSGETGHEHQPDDWSLSFGGIRIVDIRFGLSFRGSRFSQRDNLAAQFPLIFKYLKSGVFIFPQPDGRDCIRSTRRNCRRQN